VGAVVKKAKARERHRRVAEEFRQLMQKKPDMTRREKIKFFDAVADSAYLEEIVNSD
jgi:hypothetical protein